MFFGSDRGKDAGSPSPIHLIDWTDDEEELSRQPNDIGVYGYDWDEQDWDADEDEDDIESDRVADRKIRKLP